jgi:hypothetical protein
MVSATITRYHPEHRRQTRLACAQTIRTESLRYLIWILEKPLFTIQGNPYLKAASTMNVFNCLILLEESLVPAPGTPGEG